jgi:Uma2 family endonuclease
MAGEAAHLPWVSYEDYLALEREADQRHEWLDGRAYAMAGGTLTHAELASAMQRELGNLALTCGCRVFSSDAKVRVLATGLATYPDASMVCGAVERDPADANAMTNPAVLVEVLSESTERYDRGEKFAHYRRLPSLRDYVLVSQHEPRVEVYSRADGRRWIYQDAGPGEQVPLTAFEGLFDVDRVYRGVELEPDARAAR